MAKKLLTVILLFVLTINLFSQTTKRTPNFEPEKESLINWMPLDSALAKQKKAPKKIFVDIYTDWCGWCKHMAKTTFANKQIAAYINQNYYPVRFNGETTDTMIYLGDTLVNKNIGRRGAHQLTMKLTNKRPSYPTISYLDERGYLISPVPGYKSVNEIEPFLVFFTENVFRTAPFDKFQENFKKTFTDSLKIKPAKVKWLSFAEAEKKEKKEKKIILVNAVGPWSVSGKIMDTTSFGNPELAKYINEKFYPVKIDILSKDTITFFGEKYAPGNNIYPVHHLADHLMSGKIFAPSMIFISPEGKLLSHVPGYFTPESLEPILHFFEEGAFKTTPWAEYMKNYKKKSQNEKPSGN